MLELQLGSLDKVWLPASPRKKFYKSQVLKTFRRQTALTNQVKYFLKCQLQRSPHRVHRLSFRSGCSVVHLHNLCHQICLCLVIYEPHWSHDTAVPMFPWKTLVYTKQNALDWTKHSLNSCQKQSQGKSTHEHSHLCKAMNPNRYYQLPNTTQSVLGPSCYCYRQYYFL